MIEDNSGFRVEENTKQLTVPKHREVGAKLDGRRRVRHSNTKGFV